jgi:photosystem II stability/assembly factor-like uncharacterized protein
MRHILLGALLLAAGCSAPATPWPRPGRETQSANTTALLQAVSAVSGDVVWVSGQRGTWARSLDGGRSWQAGTVAGGETLQFRDVYAQSADTAWLLSSGNGPLSRIYHTTDGGQTWALQFQNADSAAFYDCMDFWDGTRGLVFGDEVQGRMMVLQTDDGAHWSLIPKERLPAALPGEGGFAASGTCLVTRPGGHAWIATGNGPASRVLHTADYGQSWTADTTPIASGEAAGAATIAIRDPRHAAVLGGPISDANAETDNVALTGDGGRTWTTGGRPTFPGAVYGAAFVPGSNTLVAVGPRGSSLSVDGGRHWSALDSLNYWGLGFAPNGAGWLVGPNGRISHLIIR